MTITSPTQTDIDTAWTNIDNAMWGSGESQEKPNWIADLQQDMDLIAWMVSI